MAFLWLINGGVIRSLLTSKSDQGLSAYPPVDSGGVGLKIFSVTSIDPKAPQLSPTEQWKKPWLLRVDIGDEKLPSYMGIIK